jgi:lysophospholipase L1-like esterase
VSTRLAPTARKLGRALRDAWLMLGIALLMILVLEVCYRAQASGRRALRPTRSTGSIKSPYADSVWLPKYAAEYANTFQLRWKPYVYFRRPPFNGSMIQVDSLGHRRTIPGPQAATDTTHVFFFGGSTMWGSNLRDSATIASVTAQRLEQSAPPGMTFHVTNFGESGYVFTQGMLELQMQLRQGNIPDVVVFYDGINDVAAAAQRGEAGVPQNETNRSREFEFGRAIYGTETGVGSDWRAARAIGTAIAQRFQFVQRLTGVVRARALPTYRPGLAQDVVSVYTSNVDMIEALSREYGFQALFVWQPAIQTTSKRLTAFERQLLDGIERDEFQRRILSMHRQIAPMLDSVMSELVGSRFINQSSLFAGDTISVFSDEIGHNTEKSIPTIVNGFYRQLAAAIDALSSKRSAPSSGKARRSPQNAQ